MVDNLVIKDTKKVREEFTKINPSIDMTMEVFCEECDHTMKGAVPIGLDFFWPDIEV